MPGTPDNWQHQVVEALAEFRKSGPVYAIALPSSWKGELSSFMRDGQLNKMFGVKRVAFSEGKTIEKLEDPSTTKTKTEKPKR